MPDLIGRDHPAATLRGAVERALTSHGSLVLVTGEAGVGKSALVAEAAGHARRAGARVLSAACWEGEGTPGYWPWIQIGRRLGADLLDGAGSAFELYDAVTARLVAASRERPVVVVLEDLHWADPASLKLLDFVVRHAWFERLLVVGTAREGEAELPADLKATTLALTGLDRDEVGELVARTAGREPGPGLVAEIHRRTGGNPFFVEQTARLWQGGSPLETIPPGVGAAIDRRLSRLSADTLDILRTAAVLGGEFDEETLSRALGRPVASPLGQAAAAGLVAPLGPGRSAFVHDLVRETLYAGLPGDDRRARHAAALAALGDALPAERAHHAYLAASPDAAGLLLDAARDAGARLSDEEAVGHYRRALELVPDAAARADLQLDLGTTLHRLGDDAGGRAQIEAATETARALDDPDLLARVALKLYSAGHPEFAGEAHRRLLDGDTVRMEEVAGELNALATSRARLGTDDQALGEALMTGLVAIWGPGTARERLAIAEELSAVAERSGDVRLRLQALSWRAACTLELGDPAHLSVHRALTELSERSGLPLFVHDAALSGARLALLTGDFAEVRRLAEVIRELGEQPYVGRDDLRWTQLCSVALLQGRFDELDTVLGEMREARSPHFPLYNAVCAVQLGDADGAVRHLAEIMAAGEPYLRWMAPLWLRFQAQAAALSKDPELCRRARAAIAPYAGQWAITGSIGVDGPYTLWIAVIDAALGHLDAAEAGFTEARRQAEALGAWPWAVEARARLIEVLAARGEDVSEAAEEVEHDAARLGMLVRLPRRGSHVFRREGEVWTLAFGGRTVHLPDAKGLRDLHVLLGRPGAELPAVSLLNPAGGAEVVAARTLGGDDVLDETAKADYRRRLELLDEEIDAAALLGDQRRAAEYDAERQALLDELRRASGLGGRARRLGDEAERARKAVTNRIRNTLRQLDERHPELAAHLRECVSTGAVCRYQPTTPVTWTL
ncbi:ATP-binding protein [Nonomuraea longicatena]|uniref:AAA family ATPase n=1 Tax=Nonomuraea longicatena TaxID=83682 RepID=A0ABN1P5Y2_9ACTN